MSRSLILTMLLAVISVGLTYRLLEYSTQQWYKLAMHCAMHESEDRCEGVFDLSKQPGYQLNHPWYVRTYQVVAVRPLPRFQ